MLIQTTRFAAFVAAAVSASALAALTLPVAAQPRTAIAATAPYPTLSEPRVFARGNAQLYNPDGIVITHRFVYVDYQGQSDHLPGPSTIVKYDMAGRIVNSVALDGRCDGLRFNPYTHLLWATLNNDGQNGHPKRQPKLYTIDPDSLAVKLYTFPAVQPHGGGYDDIAFTGGHAYLAAASPTLNALGINDKPAVVEATLTSAGKVEIAPVLYGNATGYDATNNKTARFNISDPDSLAIDDRGRLVLVGDNDQEVIVITDPRPGTEPKIIRYGLGTQFDDIAWTRGTAGTLWIADTTLDTIYTVQAKFSEGTVFGEGPLGTPVQSFIGTFATGIGGGGITPLLTARNGIVNPTSLEFVMPSGQPGP